MKRQFMGLMTAGLLGLVCWTAVPAGAQANKADKPAAAKAGKSTKASVYCCKECKTCYTESACKKMGGKDKMGHKLAKMANCPAGCKMAGEKSEKKSEKKSGKMADKKMKM